MLYILLLYLHVMSKCFYNTRKDIAISNNNNHNKYTRIIKNTNIMRKILPLLWISIYISQSLSIQPDKNICSTSKFTLCFASTHIDKHFKVASLPKIDIYTNSDKAQYLSQFDIFYFFSCNILSIREFLILLVARYLSECYPEKNEYYNSYAFYYGALTAISDMYSNNITYYQYSRIDKRLKNIFSGYSEMLQNKNILFAVDSISEKDLFFIQFLTKPIAILVLDSSLSQKNLILQKENNLLCVLFLISPVETQKASRICFLYGGGSYKAFFVQKRNVFQRLVAYVISFIIILTFILSMVFIMYYQYIKRRRERREEHLTSAALAQLPLFFYKAEKTNEESCIICLEVFEETALCRALPCDHIYHSYCIDPWLTSRSAKCPYCRKKVET